MQAAEPIAQAITDGAGRFVLTDLPAGRVEIQATSVVNGDIVAKSIVVVEGGRINGAVRMDDAIEGRPPELVKSSPVAVVR